MKVLNNLLVKAGIIVDNYVAIGTDSPYAGYNIDSRGSHNFGNTSTEVYHYFQSSNVTGGSALSVYANNLSANSSRSHIMLADTAASVPTRFGLGVYTGASPYAYLDSASKLVINNASGANVIIGGTTDAGFKLDVIGSGRFTSYLNVNHTNTNIAALDVRASTRDITLYIDNTRGTGTNYAGIFQASGVANNIAGYFNATYGVTNVALKADYGDVILNNASGTTTIGSLAGTGSRMVVVNSSGVLSTQAIPSGNAGTVTSIATTGPITGGTITSSGTIGITQATTSTDGYLSSTDWNTFNGKQAALGFTPVTNARTITINGTAYDLTSDRSWTVGTVTGSGSMGYVPKWATGSELTNGMMYDAGTAVLIGTQTTSSAKFMVYSASADNHYQAIGSGPSFRFADTIVNPNYTGIVALATSTGQFISGAVAGDMVLANNTTSSIGNFIFGTGATERMRITPAGNVSINNTNNTFRLDVNGTVRFTGQLRLESTITNGTYTYTLPGATGTLALTSQLSSFITLTSLSASSPLSYNNTTGAFSISQASGSTNGFLSSTDWTTFNNKQNALTNPVTGTGTTNYLPKFTGTSTIGNSQIFDNGTNVGIGTASPISYANKTNLAIQGAWGGQLDIMVGSLSHAQFGTDNYGSGLSARIQSADGIVFRTNGGTETMRLNASGNLLVGTTSTWGASSGRGLIELNGSSNSLIALKYSDALASYWYGSASFSEIYSTPELRFSVNGGVRLTIASTGAATFSSSVTAGGDIQGANGYFTSKVGIGTNNYVARLNVATSNVRLEFDEVNSTNGYLELLNSARSATNYFSIYNRGFNVWTRSGGTGSYVQSFTLTDTGNVGIGTTSPGRRLEVYSATSDTRIAITNSISGSGAGAGFELLVNNADAYAYNYMTGHMIFGTSSTERMRITSGGNVVIGGTNAASRFNVRGQNSNSQIEFDNFGSGVNYILSYDRVAAAYKDIVLITNASNNTLYASTSGNVGIGTTSPATKLHVSNNGAYGIEIDVANEIIQAYNRSTSDYNEIKIYSSNLRFFNGTSSTITERMRITSGGNVGIGTASPNVTGFGGATALTIQASIQPVLELIGSTYNAGGVFGGGVVQFRNSSTAVATLGVENLTGNQGNMVFYTNDGSTNTERMRITSGGSVGIGTTSPSYLLDVNGIGRFSGGYQTPVAIFERNADYGQVITLGRKGVGADAGIGYPADSTLGFYTASTERMRITSGGNVSIGNTNNTYKLDVTGQVRATAGYVFDNQTGSGTFSWYGFGGNIYAYSSSVGNLATINGSTGAYTATSDINKKKDFELSNLGLDAVMGLKPTLYRMKSEYGTQKHLGFIAQEVKDYIPQAYAENNGFIGLTEMPIIAALTKAVQEQQAQIEELKSQLNK